MNRDFYKVLLVGSSGSGKTFAFRNMDPATTGFINVEDKPLPFKNTFKYHARPSTYTEVINTLIDYAKNPDIKVIVVDSFSAFTDLVLLEARATKRGFDIWSMYNDEIAKFNSIIKKIKKEVFVTAHYEILNTEGTSEKRVKVKAKEHEGQIEKEYTVVMYAEKKFDDNNKPNYYLSLVGENTSAKCPPDIFGEEVRTIPNDGNFIVEKILEFVK